MFDTLTNHVFLKQVIQKHKRRLLLVDQVFLDKFDFGNALFALNRIEEIADSTSCARFCQQIEHFQTDLFEHIIRTVLDNILHLNGIGREMGVFGDVSSQQKHNGV